MKRTDQEYKRALELCGINPASITIDQSPIHCTDEENRPFKHTNGCKWFQFDRQGNCIARGWITYMLRVSKYGNDKNLTGHIVLPYGGSWKHPFETAYQLFRWKGDFSIG